MSSSYYTSQNQILERFDTMSDLSGTVSNNIPSSHYPGQNDNRDNFGYSSEYRKDAGQWWDNIPQGHPANQGLQSHQNAHEQATWSNGRFLAPHTSTCKISADCFQSGKNCDSGLAFATQCIAYEPWRVSCSGGRCIVDG